MRHVQSGPHTHTVGNNNYDHLGCGCSLAKSARTIGILNSYVIF